MATKQNLKYFDNEDWIINLELLEDDGSPVDLTGALIEVDIGDSLLASTINGRISVTDVANGLATVTIRKEVHLAEPSYMPYNVRATDSNDDQRVFIYGTFHVKDGKGS